MNYVEQLVDGVNAYFDLNLATLSGAIDIIVVEQPDGSLKSTPFHVRFGKIMLLRASQKVVTISVNGKRSKLNMKLGNAGEAFFVEDPPPELDGPSTPLPEYLLTSPIIAPLSSPTSPTSPPLSSPLASSSDTHSPLTSVSPPARGRSCSPALAQSTSSLPDVPPESESSSLSSPSPTPFSSPSMNPTDSPSKRKGPLASSLSSSSLRTIEKQSRKHSKSQLIQKEKVTEETSLTSFLSLRMENEASEEKEPNDMLLPAPILENKGKGGESRKGEEQKMESQPMQIAQDEIEEIEECFFSPPLPMTRINTSDFNTSDHKIGSESSVEYSVFKPVFHTYDRTKEDEEIYGLHDDIEYLQLNDEEIPFFDSAATNSPSMTLHKSVSSSPARFQSLTSSSSSPVAAGFSSSSSDSSSSSSSTSSTSSGFSSSSSAAASSSSSSSSSSSTSPSSSSPNDQNPEDWEWSWGWGTLPVMKRQHGGVVEACPPPQRPMPCTPAFPRRIEHNFHLVPEQQSQENGELGGWWGGETWWGDSFWTNSVEATWVAEKEREQEALETEAVEEQPSDERVSPMGPDVEISACLEELKNQKKLEKWDEIFDDSKLGYEDFSEGLTRGPEFFSQSDIAFRVNGQIYCSWEEAVIAIISWSAFHRPPPPRFPTPIEGLSDVEERDPLLLLRDSSSSSSSSSAGTAGRRGWLSWFWWQKNSQQHQQHRRQPSSQQLELPPSQIQEDPKQDPEQKDTATTPTESTPPSSEQKMKKTLRPTSEMLKKLKLKKGCNTIAFSVETELRGRQEIHAHIWLWSHKERIVISDIDGTITRSDVFGQILPLLGKDWSHSGVTELYTAISKHGYKMMYLSSRAIGQSYLTKTFISSVKQGEHKLPPGPVLLSPDRLLTSFNREVILRMPQVFKIAVLKDIVSLFPADQKPFYAGFGNRMSDVIAYQEAGTPLGKVFMINPTGEIRIPVKSLTYKKSYSMMSDLIQHMFPPICTSKPHVDEEFGGAAYWSLPPPTVVDPEW